MNIRSIVASWVNRRADACAAVCLFVLSLSVYLYTLCPTIYWGDCGELAAAGYVLGIAHPTGYPLWCLIAKAWTVIFPFGSVIWRLNVLSAVFGASAVAVLFGFARTIGLPRPIACFTTALFAFSFAFWQQCLIAETYTLTALYTCSLLFLVARWRLRGCALVDLYRFAFVYGLALTNHQTNTLFLPGFVTFILLSNPKLRALGEAATRRQWLTAFGIGAIPLVAYVYLPLRAVAHPAVDWGHPSTFTAFRYHVTGGYFQHMMFTAPLHDFVKRLSALSLGLGREFAWPLIAVAVFGLALVWRRNAFDGGGRALAVLSTWIVVIDLFYTSNYAIYNGYIYLIPTCAVISVLIGFGIFGGWKLLPIRANSRPSFARIGAVCCVVLVGLQIASHFRVTLCGNWICYDYARNMLQTAPPNAIMIDNNEVVGYPALTYVQVVDHVRPDVVVINRELLSNLFEPDTRRWDNVWVLDKLVRKYPEAARIVPACGISPQASLSEEPLKRLIVCALSTGRPVVVDALQQSNPIADGRGGMITFPAYLEQHYDVVQVGLLNYVYARGQRPADARLYAETERVWRGYRERGVYDGFHERDPFLFSIATDYAWGNLARARAERAARDYSACVDSYSKVLTLFPCTEATSGIDWCRNALSEQRKSGHGVVENAIP